MFRFVSANISNQFPTQSNQLVNNKIDWHLHSEKQHKTLDVITVFHKASSPASLRVQNLLKRISANVSAGATEDQASDHSAQSNFKRQEFELEVTEEPPTEGQLKSILEYVGPQKVGSLVKGAKNEADAIIGENESEILKMVNSLPKN